MLPGFFNLFSQSHDYLNSLDAETSGTTRKRISRSKLGQALIPVPPLPEQQRIVGILDEAFAAIATAKANTEKNLTNARAVFESHANSLWRTEHAGWTRTELGKVADRVTVGHVGITSPYYRDSGVLFLRTQNVTAQGIDLSEAKYITQEFHDSLKKSQVQPGDVLLSRVISREVNCGRVPEDIGPANCANVVAVRPGAKLVPDFLVYYIRSTDAQAYLLSRKVGSAQLVVNTTVVKKWPIVVPPVAVQRELVARLNRLHAESQRLESLSQQKLAALDALKKSLLHQAFTGRLTDRSAGSVNV
jgi:type I restriction enzyme S subunit